MAAQNQPSTPLDAEPSLLLETLTGRLPVGVIMLRPNRELLWANRHAHDLLGGRPQSIAGHLADAFAGHEIHDARVTIERNRRSLVVELTAAPAGGDSGIVAVIVADVTERDCRERAEAEFVENAAHQLRNPIAAIGASVAALNSGASEDPAERDRFLGHIGRESARIGSLVDALLTLAALQRGESPPRIEVLALHPLLQDAADTVSGNVRIVIDCPRNIAVVADGALFAQALVNVVENAAFHARSEVRIEACIHDATAVVDVRDDGPGIPADARESVFKRFFRAPGVAHRGSGLGLAIASAAAEAGQSTLELLPPEDGAGATFRFTIPGAMLL